MKLWYFVKSSLWKIVMSISDNIPWQFINNQLKMIATSIDNENNHYKQPYSQMLNSSLAGAECRPTVRITQCHTCDEYKGSQMQASLTDRLLRRPIRHPSSVIHTHIHSSLFTPSHFIVQPLDKGKSGIESRMDILTLFTHSVVNYSAARRLQTGFEFDFLWDLSC